MKYTVAIIAVLIAFSVSSCNKTSSTPTPGQGNFTGTLSNNTSFNLSGPSTVFIKDTLNGRTFISITGIVKINSSDTTVANISINGVTGVGTYPLETPNTNTYPMGIIFYIMQHIDGYASLPSQGIPVPAGGPGSVIITSFTSTTIEGTYSTKMTNSANNILTMQGTFSGTFLR